MLSIGGFLDLVVSSVGETDAKQTDFVSVRGWKINIGFNQCLPFFDHWAKLVPANANGLLVTFIHDQDLKFIKQSLDSNQGFGLRFQTLDYQMWHYEHNSNDKEVQYSIPDRPKSTHSSYKQIIWLNCLQAPARHTSSLSSVVVIILRHSFQDVWINSSCEHGGDKFRWTHHKDTKNKHQFPMYLQEMQ